MAADGVAHVLDRLSSSQDARVDDLQRFVQIPSVSADLAHQGDLARAAEFLVRRLGDAGLQRVRLVPTTGHPAVVAEWTGHDDAPTLLVYGHYDVQPAVKEDGWTRDPWSGAVADGRVWGRGASDMKGPMLCHVHAIEAWLQETGSLPVNVKVLFEGEEEIGSTHFDEVVEKECKDLDAQMVLISDSPMRDEDTPTIGYSLRGLVYLEVHVEGPPQDLHSGVFGGVVRNPLDALVALLASLKDPETGAILPEGFHDGIREASDEELRRLEKEGEAAEGIAAAAGVRSLWCPEGSPQACLGLRPTLEVHGIWGGYAGPGSKTVIPAEAHAKLSARLVADQDPAAVGRAIIEHLRRHAPAGVHAHMDLLHRVHPVRIDPQDPILDPIEKALEQTWGRPAVRLPVGGSIGAVAKLRNALDVKPVLIGFGQRDEGMHGPDESFRIRSLHRGAEAVARILGNLGDEGKGEKGR